MSRYPFKAIVAVAENGVIGMGMSIPWHIPEDFRHFKKTTMGGIIVMGRRTWESIGARPLPGRENAVISSRDGGAEGAKVFRNLDELESHYAGDPRQIWICGGSRLYEAALPKCSEVVLSRVKLRPEGDAFLPSLDAFYQAEKISESPQFDVFRYLRK